MNKQLRYDEQKRYEQIDIDHGKGEKLQRPLQPVALYSLRLSTGPV